MKIVYILLGTILFSNASMCLADSVVQIDENGRTRVQVRSREDNYEAKKAEKTKEKLADLLRACSLGYIDQVKQIVKKHITDVSPGGIKIDINGQDQDGNSPLISACQYGRFEVVKFLLGIPSIRLSIKSGNGGTPLIAACGEPEEDEDEADKQARSDIVQLILNTKIKKEIKLDLIDARVDGVGWTALMFASYNGDKKIVELLLRAGANLELTDFDGLTAWDLASTDEVRELLEGKSKT